jgi:hypothetical protein
VKVILRTKGEYRARIAELRSNGISVITPCFVPSMSSSKDQFYKSRFVLLWKKIPTPISMISAFDAGSILGVDAVKSSCSSDRILYLDSGCYEHEAATNTDWTQDAYLGVANALKPEIVVSPDKPADSDLNDSVTSQIGSLQSFVREFGSGATVAFLLRQNGSWEAEKTYHRVISELVKEDSIPSVIGVADSELGVTAMDRITSVRLLRTEMDRNGLEKKLIHVFGCSEPIMFILYSAAGADIFDATGWYRYAYRSDRCSRGEASALPLLNCRCRFCIDAKWRGITYPEYDQRLALHNLSAIESYFAQLRAHIIDGSLSAWISQMGMPSVQGVLL